MSWKTRGLAACLVASASLAVARDPSRLAPEGAPSSGDVAPAAEPGERLEVKGVVYAPDGRTPVAEGLRLRLPDRREGLLPAGRRDGQQEPAPDGAAAHRRGGPLLVPHDPPGQLSGHARAAAHPLRGGRAGQGTRIFEIVFEQDPNVTAEIREQAAEPGSIYSLRRDRARSRGRGPRHAGRGARALRPGQRTNERREREEQAHARDVGRRRQEDARRRRGVGAEAAQRERDERAREPADDAARDHRGEHHEAERRARAARPVRGRPRTCRFPRSRPRARRSGARAAPPS